MLRSEALRQCSVGSVLLLALSCAVPEATLEEGPGTGGVRPRGGTGGRTGGSGGAEAGGMGGTATGGGTGTGAGPTSDCPSERFTVATGVGTAPATRRRLAISGDTIYFASQGSPGIYTWYPGLEVPLTCTTAGIAQSASALAVNDSAVFFSTQSAVFRATLDGCNSPTKVADLMSAGPARDLIADSESVYFIDGNDTADAQIRRCTGSCAAPEALAQGLEAPEALAVDETHVYVTLPSQGLIRRIDKSTLAPEDFARGLTSPTAIVVDATHVYFASGEATGKVFRCEKAGGPCAAPVELTPDAPSTPLSLPSALVLLAGRVVWTNSGADTLTSCPLGGCVAGGPSVVSTGTRPLEVTGFLDCALWLDEADSGSVYAVKLPE